MEESIMECMERMRSPMEHTIDDDRLRSGPPSRRRDIMGIAEQIEEIDTYADYVRGYQRIYAELHAAIVQLIKLIADLDELINRHNKDPTFNFGNRELIKLCGDRTKRMRLDDDAEMDLTKRINEMRGRIRNEVKAELASAKDTLNMKQQAKQSYRTFVDASVQMRNKCVAKWQLRVARDVWKKGAAFANKRRREESLVENVRSEYPFTYPMILIWTAVDKYERRGEFVRLRWKWIARGGGDLVTIPIPTVTAESQALLDAKFGYAFSVRV